MSAEVSGWIPRRRIRILVGIACALAGAVLVGTVWSLAALALLVPALGAGWAAFERALGPVEMLSGRKAAVS